MKGRFRSRCALVGLAAVLIGVQSSSGDAVSIVWSAQAPGAAISKSDGVELAPGMLVRLGVFDLDEAGVRAAETDVETLESHFTEISREVVGTFGASIRLSAAGTTFDEVGTNWEVAGGFAQKVSFDAATWAGGLEGRRFYIWAVDAETASDPELGEQAIFSDASWVLPPGAQATFHWDVSSVEPTVPADVYVATEGDVDELSLVIGGRVNKMVVLEAIDLLADEDGDGVLRLLEEAFGGSPEAWDDEGVLPERVDVVVDGIQRIGLRYRQKVGGTGSTAIDYAAGGFEYRVQASMDLGVWADVGGEDVSVVSTVDNGDGTETVTVAYVAEASSIDGRLFLRVGVRAVP